MKYLLIAIVNTIYGIALLLTLSKDTIGFSIVFTVGAILTILGLVGLVLWIKMAISSTKGPIDDERIKNWWGFAKAIDIVLILGLISRFFIVQPFVVDGNSMEPNYHDKEAILVDKVSFRFRSPQRGEVIIFKAPPNPQIDYIKRIIAVPGDTIKIQNQIISINGYEIKEPYLAENTKTLVSETNPEETFEEKLKSDEYFVMGDNRNNSSDSREWGVLRRTNIIGRAGFVIYPFRYFGFPQKSYPQFGQKLSFSFNEDILLRAL